MTKIKYEGTRILVIIATSDGIITEICHVVNVKKSLKMADNHRLKRCSQLYCFTKKIYTPTSNLVLSEIMGQLLPQKLHGSLAEWS